MTSTEIEQIKLTAAYLNGCAVALLVMGGFGLVLETTSAAVRVADGMSPAIYGVLYLLMLASVLVHIGARMYLRQLDA